MSGGGPPERWLVLRVERPSDPGAAELAVEALLELPVRGVEERDEHFLVYLPSPDGGDPSPAGDDPSPAGNDPSPAGGGSDRIVGRVAAVLEQVVGAPLDIEVRWQPHEEWEESWRRGLAPRRVTSRLVVSPSWMDPELRPGELLVVVDPGMAFGTAEHPTTRGSLRLLDRLVEPGDRIADVGAGSGILSIAAARLGASEVVALELDAWSCAAARENVELNGVTDRVRVHEKAVAPGFLPDEAPFDGVVANIESGILVPLLPGFHAGLRPGGWIVLSGILTGEAADVTGAATDAGFAPEAEEEEEGWWTAAFRSEPETESVTSRPSGDAAR